MEFNEKLQELRKQKGLTQEELAGALFVSRTAVSKWEAGRGYPNIDSLKAIAKFFSVTLDDLLSGDERLTIAEADTKQKEKQFLDLIFGLVDISTSMLFFLPFFAAKSDGILLEGPLFSLTEIQPYLKIAYFAVVIGMICTGILTLALQSCQAAAWIKSKEKLSFGCSMAAVLLFIISLQPYAAVFTFVLLAIKVFVRIKRA